MKKICVICNNDYEGGEKSRVCKNVTCKNKLANQIGMLKHLCCGLCGVDFYLNEDGTTNRSSQAIYCVTCKNRKQIENKLIRLGVIPKPVKIKKSKLKPKKNVNYFYNKLEYFINKIEKNNLDITPKDMFELIDLYSTCFITYNPNKEQNLLDMFSNLKVYLNDNKDKLVKKNYVVLQKPHR